MTRGDVAGALAGLLLFTTRAPAGAQTTDRPFADLGRYLEPGDTIYVTARATGETGGTLVRLSDDTIVLDVDGDERAFDVSDIGWLERFPDPVWDGVLAGATGGYVSIMALGALCCTDELAHWPAQRAGLAMAAVFAVVGLAADAADRERVLVYGARPRGASTVFRSPEPVSSLGDAWRLVRPGDTVRVTARGQELTGTFDHASPSTLGVVVGEELIEVPAADVRRLQRRSTRVLQGMLIGAASGTVLRAAWPYDSSTRGESAAVGGVQGWLFGTIAGYLWPRHLTVYGDDTDTSVSLEPTFLPGGGGLALSVGF